MPNRLTLGRSACRVRTLLGLITCALSAAACSGGGGNAAEGATPAGTVSESVWRSLATGRPEPLGTAARVSLGQVGLADDDAFQWRTPGSELGFSELVVAGLLRRPDVHFVERRRFSAAAEASRRGTLPPDAPRLGVSVGPEYIFSVTWAPLVAGQATLEMRLTDPETGEVRRSWREVTPDDADPVGLARTVVGSLVAELTDMGRAPMWSDPVPSAAPDEFVRTAVGVDAVGAYLRGLAAEEDWDWEAARRGYQSALAADPGFFEARVALARTARLRLGGTLAAS